MIAVEKGNYEIMEYLLNHGADRSTRNSKNKSETALTLACRFVFHTHKISFYVYIEWCKGPSNSINWLGSVKRRTSRGFHNRSQKRKVARHQIPSLTWSSIIHPGGQIRFCYIRRCSFKSFPYYKTPCWLWCWYTAIWLDGIYTTYGGNVRW